jgi:hypothetical protein
MQFIFVVQYDNSNTNEYIFVTMNLDEEEVLPGQDQDNGLHDERNAAGDLIIDPFDQVSRNQFIDAIRDCIDGEQFGRVLETLPKINGALGV